MTERKCNKCGADTTWGIGGKWFCSKHQDEAKKNYARNTTIYKNLRTIGLILVGALSAVGGLIIIYQYLIKF